MSFISLFFTPLTSVVGHLCAAGDAETTKKYYDYFFCLNYILGVFFYLGYYAVIDNVVMWLFGTGLQVSRAIAFVITLNQFTQYMRKATLLFRDASGAFYYDRWKPIAEGLSNLVLSLIFVNAFPEQYRVTRVSDIDKTYLMPKAFVSYRKPRRLSAEQREAARNRMQKMNQGGV